MHRVRSINISFLLVLVLILGAASITCAYQTNRGVWFYSGDVAFVPDRMPYIEAYATYHGTALYYQFRAVVGLNVNSGGYEYDYGQYSWSSSYAYVYHQPSYATDTYTWTHYYEYEPH